MLTCQLAYEWGLQLFFCEGYGQIGLSFGSSGPVHHIMVRLRSSGLIVDCLSLCHRWSVDWSVLFWAMLIIRMFIVCN